MSEFKVESHQGVEVVTKDGHILFREDIVKNFHWLQHEIQRLQAEVERLKNDLEGEYEGAKELHSELFEVKQRAESLERERDEYKSFGTDFAVCINSMAERGEIEPLLKSEDAVKEIVQRFSNEQQVKVLEELIEENSDEAFSHSVARQMCQRKIEQLRKKGE